MRDECPEAPHEVYVDDMAQMATGDREHLLRVVPPAAACLREAISQVGGIFSSRSTIVATSIKLARDIARKLARCHGVHAKVAQNTSDLGVDFAGSKKRRLATHKRRQAKGKVTGPNRHHGSGEQEGCQSHFDRGCAPDALGHSGDRDRSL